MAYSYVPSLDDIPQASSAGYTPSLEDLPAPPQSTGAPVKISDLMRQKAIENDPIAAFMSKDPQVRGKLNKTNLDRIKGAGQSVANYPIEIANLFKDKPFGKFNFAPQNQAGQEGQTVGDVASFFMPGGVGRGLIKGATMLPKIGDVVNAMTKGVASTPWLNSLLKIGETGGQAGLYNAAKNPESPGISGLEGLGIGGGTQLAANLLTSRNPIVNLLARLGVGTGVGYGVGHPAMGAAAGLMAPQLASMLGMGGAKNELLEGLNFKDVSRAKLANDRLGTPITPAQASGNYVTAGLEGNLKRTPQGAQTGYRLEQSQSRSQQNAINDMLDNIYKPTAESESNINSLYAKANLQDVDKGKLNKWRQNPVVENAFKTVSTIPSYQNISPTNYKYLAEVDRQLFRDQKAAEGNKPNVAHAIGKVKYGFNQFLKDENPAYEAATAAAQPKMVRESIEGRFNKNDEDFTGKNFYNKFLNTRKSYSDILSDTKNFPDAQQAIKDMRQGWKHLSNIKTVSQGEAQAKTGIADARDQLKVIWNAMKTIAGAKKDVKGLKFIYSKDWDKQFDKIMQQKEQSQRNRDLATLLGKMSIATGLSPTEQ